MINFKIYDTLPKDAVFIRNKVFVEEQGFRDEFDDLDLDARHIVLYVENEPAATLRYFWDEKNNSYVAGRIAVLREFRGKSFGAAVLKEAEKQIKNLGKDKLMLAAQVRAKGFYEKQGYRVFGEEFLEECCPHIWMYKNLNE